MSQQPDDLPSLTALQDKIDHAKPPEKTPGSAGMEYSKDISIAVQFIVELVAGVGVGAGIGYFLDHWLETSPIFLIIFLLLGTVAGARNMMKSAKANKEDTSS